MTSQRDIKIKPKKDERPKVKKETLKDLDTQHKGAGIRGGGAGWTGRQCAGGAGTNDNGG